MLGTFLRLLHCRLALLMQSCESEKQARRKHTVSHTVNMVASLHWTDRMIAKNSVWLRTGGVSNLASCLSTRSSASFTSRDVTSGGSTLRACRLKHATGCTRGKRCAHTRVVATRVGSGIYLRARVGCRGLR